MLPYPPPFIFCFFFSSTFKIAAMDDLTDGLQSMSFNSSLSEINRPSTSSGSETTTTWTASSLSCSTSTNHLNNNKRYYTQTGDPYWDGINRIRSESVNGKVSLSDLKFVQRLGSGDIGNVYLVELKGIGIGITDDGKEKEKCCCYYAGKVMDKKELESRNKQGRAKMEMEILEMLDHPFLPTLYSYCESSRWSCLVTEFCPGGDLHVLRQRQPFKRFDESAVRFYASEITVAMEYVHMMGIVYRDLKPENVLVRADGHIMLTDFDLSLKCDNSTSTPAQIVSVTANQTPSSAAANLPHDPPANKFTSSSCILPHCIGPAVSCFRPKLRRKKKQTSRRGGPEFVVSEPVDVRSMSFVGTHEYLAPEIVSGEGHGSAVDWWTLGIFMYELLYGYTPFKGSDNEYTMANIVARALEFPKEPSVSAPVKDLITQLLVKDPTRRLGSTMGASAIKHHPFFQGVSWALLRCAKPPHVPPPFVIRETEDSDDDDSCPGTPMDYY